MDKLSQSLPVASHKTSQRLTWLFLATFAPLTIYIVVGFILKLSVDITGANETTLSVLVPIFLMSLPLTILICVVNAVVAAIYLSRQRRLGLHLILPLVMIILGITAFYYFVTHY